MAKSNRPLNVLVHPDYWNDPAVVELGNKGSDLHNMDATCSAALFDLIIGPNCWRIVKGMEDQIPNAIKAARKQRYGKAVDGE